jgi:FkbM family methyltransferase
MAFATRAATPGRLFDCRVQSFLMLIMNVGDLLDKMGRWLLVNAPALAGLYARCLRGRPQQPKPVPGWTFAGEYYPQRRWMALRRGALWECALEKGLNVPLVVPWMAGCEVELTLGNDNSLCVYVAGSFEPNEFAFVDRVLRPGMVFVDIGANEGLFTLFAARRVGRSGRVIAIEPSARERAILTSNVARNGLGNVAIVPHAMAAEPGVADLLIAPKEHGFHNTLGGFIYEGETAIASERIVVETLDGLHKRLALGRVDVVKIDVEGAELKVLGGARSLLSTYRPILLVEANEEALKRQAASTGAMLSLLLSFDYRIHVFADSGMTERWTEGMALSANIVALPGDHDVAVLQQTG